MVVYAVLTGVLIAVLGVPSFFLGYISGYKKGIDEGHEIAKREIYDMVSSDAD